MISNIIFIEKAKGEFLEIDLPTQRKIAQFFEDLDDGEDPYSLGSPLEGFPSNYWKFRIGDYRLVAEIQDNLFVVLMLAVGHRRDIYKKSVERLGG